MEDQSDERANLKDLPLYVWHNKQEGKEEYAKFAKQFKLALKHLRYLLEPGAVQRRLGPDPGPAPQQAALRREWREDKKTKPQRTQNGTCACSFEEAHATVVVAYREVQ